MCALDIPRRPFRLLHDPPRVGHARERDTGTAGVRRDPDSGRVFAPTHPSSLTPTDREPSGDVRQPHRVTEFPWEERLPRHLEAQEPVAVADEGVSRVTEGEVTTGGPAHSPVVSGKESPRLPRV